MRRCSDDGALVRCDAEVVEGGDEVCDRLDNDCDGETDEGFGGLGTACSVGVGACRVFGVRVCSEDGVVVVCDAEAGAPVDEACDGADNDCDNRADEGFGGLREPCRVGVGGCQRFGVGLCSGDGSRVQCSVSAGPVEDEVCDRLDNDCDGTTDEGYAGLGTACSVGDGVCRRVGVRVCAEDGGGVVCDAEAEEAGAETCDGRDDDCDGTVDEGYAGVGTPCSVGVGDCERAGVRVCSEDGAGVVCDAAPGDQRFERCDAVDNDCDGSIDEGYARLGQPCTAGIGACERPGVRVCAEGGLEVACDAEAGSPAVEDCNGLDDDCDTAVDEAFESLGRPCRDGVGACQRPGVNVCAEDGLSAVCDAVAAPVGAERCEGTDEDCDGTIDEGFAGLGTACVVGQGVCRVNGVRVCSGDAARVECNVEAGEGGDEICNGADDDCDGDLDEGFAGLGTACQVGVGVCLRSGVRVCAAGGQAVECDAEAGAGEAESCDGLDNDCDGASDEAYGALRTPCTVGVGLCARTGVRICTEDGAGLECDVAPGAAQQEVCDGLDNDCDGDPDEGFDGVGAPCAVGVGACRVNGVTVCAADGSAVVCDVEAGDGSNEVCDRVDNDCDGTTDEGFAELDRPCTVGEGACLRAGVRVCAANGASVVCDAQAGGAVAERCDGVDNDCDGDFDEGFAGLGTACTAGEGACLAAGVRICTADGAGVVCDASPGAPGVEGCDGIDNDCDGDTDEGYAGLRTACSEGVGACQRFGVRVCSANGLVVECEAEAGGPVGERCDGVDNDCDGETDEAFAQKGRPCSAGVGACARPGVRVCAADGQGTVCDAVAGGAVGEACDGIDNDCDGSIDEGFLALGTACSAGQGVCRRPGVNVCAGDGNGVVCDAVAGFPDLEVCDGLDND